MGSVVDSDISLSVDKDSFSGNWRAHISGDKVTLYTFVLNPNMSINDLRIYIPYTGSVTKKVSFVIGPSSGDIIANAEKVGERNVSFSNGSATVPFSSFNWENPK
jgi:hypothetical protein